MTAAIRAIYRGEHLIGPSLMEKVLRLVGEGATNKEIADQLLYSEVTIKRRLQEIFAKLGATNRAQAVTEALQRGLI